MMSLSTPTKIPQRCCIACRTVRPRAELLRFVRASAGGAVTLDLSGRAAGRGAWVCRDQRCVDTAMKRGRLSRALRISIAESDLAVAGAAALAEIGRSSAGAGQRGTGMAADLPEQTSAAALTPVGARALYKENRGV